MNALELRRRTLGKGVYKKTVEGNPAIAQGSLARMYPGITMQGWTEQAQYEGNNLFDINGYINDYNSIKNEDGSITIKSYAVGLKNKISDVLPDIKVGDVLYTSATNGTLVYIGGKALNINQNSSIEITESVLQNNTFGFYGSNSGEITISDITISKKYGEPYEPYTGGQPSPSPDYPQPITSAGKYNEETQKYEYRVKLTGANLFDLRSDNLSLFSITGDKQDINSGVRLTYENVRDCVFVADFAFEAGKTYFVSFDINVVSDILDGSAVSGYYEPIVVTSNDAPSWWLRDVFTIIYKIGTTHYEGMFTPEKECTMYISGNNGIGNGTGYTEITNFILTEVENAEYEPYRLPQTVTLTADRPLTKWDRLEKRNGQWGWVYKSAEIESYTDESVPGEYFSTTGQLSTGAQVWYETATVTFVPLSETEQEQMNELYTFRPTTVLSNDCECNMTLTYKTKKSLEVAT